MRESARLQSFPNDFTFPGTVRDAFKQIGNVVPPLMAYHIAKQIKNFFKDLEEELKNKPIKYDETI
jgi:DNA (cytosine-5)-methyltransferase 1